MGNNSETTQPTLTSRRRAQSRLLKLERDIHANGRIPMSIALGELTLEENTSRSSRAIYKYCFFVLDFNDQAMNRFVEHQMLTCFKEFRDNCYRHFKKCEPVDYVELFKQTHIRDGTFVSQATEDAHNQMLELHFQPPLGGPVDVEWCSGLLGDEPLPTHSKKRWDDIEDGIFRCPDDVGNKDVEKGALSMIKLDSPFRNSFCKFSELYFVSEEQNRHARLRLFKMLMRFHLFKRSVQSLPLQNVSVALCFFKISVQFRISNMPVDFSKMSMQLHVSKISVQFRRFPNCCCSFASSKCRCSSTLPNNVGATMPLPLSKIMM
ncbi:CACTA en-spm transposon protein [Cucumis melo var. makuwa]|uniref:CACTA en-spm transposon protein n=1 Tax=Cucumis melo var. makuwa TaxID=1194695 RepID=A0A5A7VB48_CUCMM|nr:CACTA en-spm transposon protein [Cucumis melo var. makuwa]TYJ96720.1 CACTA en-spm transposon protein [Cucumis melo var. makuwa]